MKQPCAFLLHMQLFHWNTTSSSFVFYDKGCITQDVLGVPTLACKVSLILKYSTEVSIDIKEHFKKYFLTHYHC